MKLVESKVEWKIVTYRSLGLLIVPSYTKYLAIDKNGSLYAYDRKPILLNTFWSNRENGNFCCVGKVENFGKWKKSLRKV